MAALACRDIHEVQNGSLVRGMGGWRVPTVPVHIPQAVAAGPLSPHGDYKNQTLHPDEGMSTGATAALRHQSGEHVKPKVRGLARTLSCRTRPKTHLWKPRKHPSTLVSVHEEPRKASETEKAKDGNMPEAEKVPRRQPPWIQSRTPSHVVGLTDTGAATAEESPYTGPRACVAAHHKVHSYAERDCHPALLPPPCESVFLWVICAEVGLPKGIDLRLVCKKHTRAQIDPFGYPISATEGSVEVRVWSGGHPGQVAEGLRVALRSRANLPSGSPLSGSQL